MNKAYIDLLELPTNAVLVYIPDSPEAINNLLETKFPHGSHGEHGVWGNGYSAQKVNSDYLVIWFYDGIYIHDEFIEDLQILGYNVVQLDVAFKTFHEMEDYIKENSL